MGAGEVVVDFCIDEKCSISGVACAAWTARCQLGLVKLRSAFGEKRREAGPPCSVNVIDCSSFSSSSVSVRLRDAAILRIAVFATVQPRPSLAFKRVLWLGMSRSSIQGVV